MNASARKPSLVLIGALTYNRPDGLDRLLAGLSHVTLPTKTDVAILIVDNSPDGTAEPTVTRWRNHIGIPLAYRHEPRRGIARARNRILDFAYDGGHDFLALIDDDEFPDPEWLKRLLARQKATRAAAVIGQVQPLLPPAIPYYFAKGRYLAYAPKTGGFLSEGISSNALIDLGLITKLGLDFDLRFDLTGGEDTDFFARLCQKRGRIAYAAGAIVYETITPKRARLLWLIKRWARTGNTNARIRRLRGRENRAYLFLVGLARILFGATQTVLTLPGLALGGAQQPINGLRIIARGWGYTTAALGQEINEYDRPWR